MQCEVMHDLDDAEYQAPDPVAVDWLNAYRVQAVQRLRERHAFNAAMIGVFERGEGTLEDFQAWSLAHDASTLALGGVLICLGELRNSEGTA